MWMKKILLLQIFIFGVLGFIMSFTSVMYVKLNNYIVDILVVILWISYVYLFADMLKRGNI
jgi:hypothetical protein